MPKMNVTEFIIGKFHDSPELLDKPAHVLAKDLGFGETTIKKAKVIFQSRSMRNTTDQEDGESEETVMLRDIANATRSEAILILAIQEYQGVVSELNRELKSAREFRADRCAALVQEFPLFDRLAQDDRDRTVQIIKEGPALPPPKLAAIG